MRLLVSRLAPLALVLVCIAPAPARAADELFESAVFPPELVIRNQRQIGFTPDQRKAFLREMQATQAELLPVQLEMSEVGASLIELLDREAVDEQATLEAATRMLELERQTKLRHMRLLIRIKNLLSSEQQTQLRRIRDGAGRAGD